MDQRWLVFDLDDAFVVVQEEEAVKQGLDREKAVFGPVAQRERADGVADALNFVRDANKNKNGEED